MMCAICPRSCKASRGDSEGEGFCRLGLLPQVARVAPHMWEEPCISGTNGSGAIFFSGCVLRCVFCQNDKISRESTGRRLSSDDLIDAIKSLESLGVHNINLVSPTPYADMLIDCFMKYKPSVPIVWNTGGYERTETIRRLEGIVDIYLPDLKYFSDTLSMRYSKAPDYFKYASGAIMEMARQTGRPAFDGDGMLKKGTMVRHLVLPSLLINSYQVLRWLDHTFPDGQILVSLMAQYFPAGEAKSHREINRVLTPAEYQNVREYLEQRTNLDGFVQELSSSSSSYVPDFDRT